MWFDEIVASEDPGEEELIRFVRNVRSFLGYVLENNESFGFLWEDDPELHELALDTYRYDIAEGSGLILDHVIPQIPKAQLVAHGLSGRPLKFKFRVVGSIDAKWKKLKGQLSIREWFKKMVDAIDAVLDSIIDAAGGVGGIIKEFKDALSALA